MALDWISNLFQSEQTRGLSGDSATAVALDDANPYYNYRLRRHKAEGDPVANPALIWYTSTSPKRRGGLGVHIASEKGEGVATFTDVLVVLSPEDHARAMQAGFPEPWSDKLARSMHLEFDEFCRREGFALRYDNRRLTFKVVCDGSEDMGGVSLGLSVGEFVTGLVPNLYTGPVKGSYPIIGVHLNLPDLWDGYREVGRLYNDQILFTIGNHWLDNFSHESLREGALYRLKQYPDGTFLHMVNPDLQEQYLVASSEEGGGASVITLATRDGVPLAYIVLAVLDPPAEAVPPPMLIDDQVQPVSGPAVPVSAAKPASHGQKTIIPEAPSERLFTMQERGALLQKVHFAAFMEGYDVFVGSRGELGTVVEDRAATFQVRKKKVSLLAHVDGVQVAGYPIAPGVEVPIEGDVQIEVGPVKFEYHDMRGETADGWPYVGEIRRPASSSYMVWGAEYRVGRARDCRVVLPDEPRNENIHWKPGIADGATIRARSGEVPKSKFYTDSIMVGSEHAAVDLSKDEPIVRCLHRQCYVYIRRGQEILALYPTESGKDVETAVKPGDELLIGNCVFQVGFTSGNVVTVIAPGPKVEFTSESLLNALGNVDIDPTPAPQPVPAAELPQPKHLTTDPADAVVAAGLGQQGKAPKPVPLLGVALEFEDEQVAPPSNPWKGGATPPPSPKRFTTAEEAALPPPRPKLDASPPTRPADFTPEPGPVRRATPAPFSEEDAPPPPKKLAPTARANTFDEDPDEPPPFNAATPVGSPSVAPPPPISRGPSIPPAPPPTTVPAAALTPAPPEFAGPPLATASPVPALFPSPLPAPAIDAPPAPPAAPAGDAPSGFGKVVMVEDAEAQFELGRKMQIVQVGWTVNGTVVCGNHSTADLQLPENRVLPEQRFEPHDYFALKVRGRRGVLEVVDVTEVLIDGSEVTTTTFDDPEKLTIDIVRRDEDGYEDFLVRMNIREDKALPDPRARMVAIDHTDPLAAALFTRGLPTRQTRNIQVGTISAGFFYDGESITVSDYLATYKQAAGFRPFFVQHGGERFQTAPEDGSPIRLVPGDRFVVGNCVFLVKSS